MKNIIIAIVIIAIIGLGGYFLFRTPSAPEVAPNQNGTGVTTGTGNGGQGGTAQVDKSQTVIGESAGGNKIIAYHFGADSATTTELLFVGGIHGGYEWNTVLVASELMKYLKANPSAIPANVKVTVVPVLNPDGLSKVVGTTTHAFKPSDVSSSEDTVISGRFNANEVDLNRNFDCDWQKNGKWQSRTVSGGSEVFSEPESQAVKDYVETNNPSAVVVWYSAAGGVFASSCHNGVSTETNKITKMYADASGYPAYQSFDFYATTGDMVNWLAKENIPAISVLLTNHTDTEWSKNLAGVKALLKYYTK